MSNDRDHDSHHLHLLQWTSRDGAKRGSHQGLHLSHQSSKSIMIDLQFKVICQLALGAALLRKIGRVPQAAQELFSSGSHVLHLRRKSSHVISSRICSKGLLSHLTSRKVKWAKVRDHNKVHHRKGMGWIDVLELKELEVLRQIRRLLPSSILG